MQEHSRAAAATPKSRVSARRAWITLAWAPLAIIVAFFVPYAVAAVIDAPFAASPSQSLSLVQSLVLFVTTAIVGAGLPVLAFFFALAPAKAGSRSGRAALIVSGGLAILIVGFCAATFA